MKKVGWQVLCNTATIQNMIAPAACLKVTRANLDILARYLLFNWDDGVPPAFASTGTDHYCLRDMVFLLATALTNSSNQGVELTWGYGPFNNTSIAETTVTTASVKQVAANIAKTGIAFGETYTWTSTPANTLEDSYSGIHTAQLL